MRDETRDRPIPSHPARDGALVAMSPFVTLILQIAFIRPSKDNNLSLITLQRGCKTFMFAGESVKTNMANQIGEGKGQYRHRIDGRHSTMLSLPLKLVDTRLYVDLHNVIEYI